MNPIKIEIWGVIYYANIAVSRTEPKKRFTKLEERKVIIKIPFPDVREASEFKKRMTEKSDEMIGAT